MEMKIQRSVAEASPTHLILWWAGGSKTKSSLMCLFLDFSYSYQEKERERFL